MTSRVMVVWTLILSVSWSIIFGYFDKYFDGADLERKKVASLERSLHRRGREMAKLESRFSEYKDALVVAGIKIDPGTKWDDPKRQIASVIADAEFKTNKVWPPGQVAFEHAKKVFVAGDFRRSAELLEDFLQRYPDNPMLPQATYLLSESYSALGNKEGTLRSINTLISHFPETEVACLGVVRLGKIFEKAERFEDAKDLYEIAVPLFPKSDCAKVAKESLANVKL